ncbi:MAG: hypothetical protein QM817_39285 [Archangium sp.]
MYECQKCQGLVPENQSACPNCSAGPKWWKWPLAILGAGFATVTLSACYGPACATTVTLEDGGTTTVGAGNACTTATYDCRDRAPDGGYPSDWDYFCGSRPATDGGNDAGTDGGSDAGP